MSTFLENYLKSLETKVVDDVETYFKDNLITLWNEMIKNKNYMQLTKELEDDLASVVLELVKKF